MKRTYRKIMVLAGFWLAATAYGAPDIDLVPASYDFGTVQAGSSDSALIEIRNVGTSVLRLDDIFLTGRDAAQFQITSFLFLPVFYGAGGSYYVEVTYAPSTAGAAEAFLRILSSDPDESVVDMPLRGQVLSDQQEDQEEQEEQEEDNGPQKESLADQIAGIIAFFDQAVAAGELDGAEAFKNRPKPVCKHKDKRFCKCKGVQVKKQWNEDAQLRAFRHQLTAVQKCIGKEWYQWAQWHLQSLYKKTDGLPRPPDFVEGPAAAELAERIQRLIESLKQK